MTAGLVVARQYFLGTIDKGDAYCYQHSVLRTIQCPIDDGRVKQAKRDALKRDAGPVLIMSRCRP